TATRTGSPPCGTSWRRGCRTTARSIIWSGRRTSTGSSPASPGRSRMSFPAGAPRRPCSTSAASEPRVAAPAPARAGAGPAAGSFFLVAGGWQVPQLDGPEVPVRCLVVVGAGGQQLAVGAQRHAGDVPDAPLQDVQLLAGGHVPQPHRRVLAARGEDRAAQ